ncbi:Replicative superfamily II helicase [Paraburkholderia tropica]|uniref:DEAD/DEAH box helicase n=1 Tax=Paraburkholderia tropica TaxID=92647 RepID=UPI001CB46ED7|nr:DEAD/DEAH box helicase [Paraburkholderia tropica]CAG9217792.1 Replicative superfamily II helicase [Paraburkholderia tropica]
MAIKAVFVGINKQSDPSIDELPGTHCDAVALWSLFTDTLPDISSRLLIGSDATKENVSKAVLHALGSARAEDVVIISFAGHGTPDGSLVFYDTQRTDVTGTTLPMATFADAFQTSKARVVLFILDACFAGHAPARVLEVEGRPRNAFTFEQVAGDGRILLAACTSTQSAWEQPGTGHGLLTAALIQAMTDEMVETVSFPAVADEIIQATRVAALAIGVTQTPAFLGHVEGGLVFPRLRRGENFQANFPSMDIVGMTGAFSDLIPHGFPQNVVDQWSTRFPDGLNTLQLKAVNEYGVLAGKSLMVVAPTSSGKTLIGELAGIQAVLGGKKAIFLLPYKALVNEKCEEFSSRYGEVGLRVVRCTGDANDTVGDILSSRYDIAFFTYEMFLNISLTSPHVLNRLGVVVLDEGQFITDSRRGITVELLLAMLVRARARGVAPQLLVLSAVLGQLNGFNHWLSIGVLQSNVRPVPLVEGVLDRTGTFQFVDVDGTIKTESLLPRVEIVQRTKSPSSQDVIVPLARRLVANGEKLIVFRHARGKAQGCARYLARELGLPPAAVLASLPRYGLTSASNDLRICLEGGTAFHNANLQREEREVVERGFRSDVGGIHVLASTTTLAAGVNTPASTVVLAEKKFVGEDGRPFTVAEYKNMAGRAGRLGFNEIGKSIILADTPFERAELFRRYVQGSPEDVKSSFSEGDLPTWVLRLLSQVQGVTATEIPALLVSTFAGYAASRANPAWDAQVAARVNQLVARTLQHNLAELESDVIHLTLLGRAVGSSSLTFESGLRLVELVKEVDWTNVHASYIICLLQVLQEMDSVYTPLMTKGASESARVADASQRYGHAAIRLLSRFGADEACFRRRCKRAAIMHDWLSGVPADVIEQRYSPNPYQGAISYGDIIAIADSTRFHVRSAQRILAALFPEQADMADAVDKLLIGLEFGLPEEGLGLVQVPIPLNRGQRLALLAHGARDSAQIMQMSDADLIACIGSESASQVATKRQAAA